MIRSSCLIVAALGATFVLSACAPMPASRGIQERSSSMLWDELTLSTDTRQIMLIEAELGSRGQTVSPYGTEYLGRRTSGTVGRAVYARTTPPTENRNCSDFPNSAAAQRFFLQAGGPVSDPHGLDRDGDGNACEWGNDLRASVSSFRRSEARKATAARQAQVSARRQSSSTCYTGPRGGTYTITASGNRNYDGC